MGSGVIPGIAQETKVRVRDQTRVGNKHPLMYYVSDPNHRSCKIGTILGFLGWKLGSLGKMRRVMKGVLWAPVIFS